VPGAVSAGVIGSHLVPALLRIPVCITVVDGGGSLPWQLLK